MAQAFVQALTDYGLYIGPELLGYKYAAQSSLAVSLRPFFTSCTDFDARYVPSIGWPSMVHLDM